MQKMRTRQILVGVNIESAESLFVFLSSFTFCLCLCLIHSSLVHSLIIVVVNLQDDQSARCESGIHEARGTLQHNVSHGQHQFP